ncbi:hypothetical protein BU17DRAFT_64397 [Hysterangium stoloniferum]|nr:hypothetical protein BU17DRAFT_64397 [Hysterangium stoloniferum]
MTFQAKLKYKTPFEKKKLLDRLFDRFLDTNWKCRSAAISEEVRQVLTKLGEKTRHLHILVEYDTSKIVFRCFTWSQDNNLTPKIEEIADTKRNYNTDESPRFAVSPKQCHAAIMYKAETPGGARATFVMCIPEYALPTFRNCVTPQNCEAGVAQAQGVNLGENIEKMAISGDRGYAVCALADTKVEVFRASGKPQPELLKKDNETSSATAVEVAKDVAVVVYKYRFYVYRIGDDSNTLLYSQPVSGTASVAAISSNTQYIAVACTTGDKESKITLWKLVTEPANGSLTFLGQFDRPKVRAMRFLTENDLVVVAKCSCYYYMLGLRGDNRESANEPPAHGGTWR